eukprot:795246-Amorphochlora_amoeboformis.AAC.1
MSSGFQVLPPPIFGGDHVDATRVICRIISRSFSSSGSWRGLVYVYEHLCAYLSGWDNGGTWRDVSMTWAGHGRNMGGT